MPVQSGGGGGGGIPSSVSISASDVAAINFLPGKGHGRLVDYSHSYLNYSVNVIFMCSLFKMSKNFIVQQWLLLFLSQANPG